MDQERRKLIVREIEYWRRGKMLPDHYCDFLLNLYLEDQSQRPASGFTGKAAAALERSTGKHWLLVFGITGLICFVALYFILFHPLLQIALTALAVITLLLLGQRYRKKNEALGITLIGTGMMLLLAVGMYLLSLHGWDSSAMKIGYLACCAMFWIIYGIGARIPLLHLCGWIASIMMYAMALVNYAADPKWYDAQLYWMPAALLFAWGTWFVQRWSKQASAVIFATAALLWFMPEVFSAIFLEETAWLQLQIILKITIGGLLLFSLRKKWIAWVA